MPKKIQDAGSGEIDPHQTIGLPSHVAPHTRVAKQSILDLTGAGSFLDLVMGVPDAGHESRFAALLLSP
jgi:hypothetical protein